MKTLHLALLLALTLLPSARAQEARFFRMAGPVASTITAFSADGYITWTNAPTNATFTVQTAASLLSPGNWVDYIQVPATNPVTTHRLIDPNPPSGMALIPAGAFTMGDTLDGDPNAVPISVTVSAFYMDVNLVSSNQWAGVYSYATSHGYSFVNAGAGKAANHPVYMVDWYDVVKWSNARSQQAGLTPVYYTDAGLTQVYMNGEVTPYVNWAANGYRLPTEAEWEKAARGGLSGHRFPWGDTISWSQANYNGCPLSLGGLFAYDLATAIGYDPTFATDRPYTSPVGYFAPNGYGLYDMAGNVREWCWDWYATPYAGGTDPRGPVGQVGGRVSRGGSCNTLAGEAQCFYRGDFAWGDGAPDVARDDIGFRCVRGL